jgi:photosynthetic reaction center H subunit
MSAGAITDNLDVAQIVLYAFWIFFFGLVYYLRGEDKREGYPLEQADASPYTLSEGFPSRPSPKVFRLPHGGTRVAPVEWVPENRTHRHARSLGPGAGSPLQPVGNPLLAGVGPGAWANRPDEPELTLEGLLKIVPLRLDSSYSVEPRDPDPRGQKVYGADHRVGGDVRDIWVDRSERLFRYYEVEVQAEDGKRRVLLPVNFCKVKGDGSIKVHAIMSNHFAAVPGLRNADQVTMLEEEKICAYYGAGNLYAMPSRLGPWL